MSFEQKIDREKLEAYRTAEQLWYRSLKNVPDEEAIEVLADWVSPNPRPAGELVEISRECAENSLNVVRSVLEDSEQQIRKLGVFKQRLARMKYRSVLEMIEATETELQKALEHSNGR